MKNIFAHCSSPLASSLYLALAFIIAPAGAVYPWVYYGQDLDGSPLTNAITIEAWPATNGITGVSTNLVAAFSKTYYPTNPAGYYSNNLAPGSYRLTIYGQTRGVPFSIVAAATNQNIAQIANIPVPVFMNFTLAQFTDAGTAAYSNATAFTLSGYSGVSNSVGFVLGTNYAGPSGLFTNNGILWISTNLATGTSPAAAAPNGSIMTTTNGAFYVRSNNAWILK